MDFWDLLSYAAWGVSILLFLWMLADFWKVAQDFDEDFLLSSREGEE
jgi:heme O synthase-like polyprenyltransferase